MSIEIDSFPLITRVQDSQSNKLQELRNVYNIYINTKREVIEHGIASSDTTILQDMGRHPIRVTFAGDLRGEKAKDSLQNLWVKFRQGKPVPFSSDISGITDLTNVLIEELSIQNINGSDRYYYSMTLSEYKPPKQQTEQEAPDQSEAAQKSVDDESDIHGVTGKVLGSDGKPKKGVKVNAKSDSGEEWQMITDENGKYEKRDLPNGTYTVTIGEKAYEGMKRIIKISKGS